MGLVDRDRWAPEDLEDLLCSKYPLVLNELSSYLSSKGYGAFAELSPLGRSISIFGMGGVRPSLFLLNLHQ